MWSYVIFPHNGISRLLALGVLDLSVGVLLASFTFGILAYTPCGSSQIPSVFSQPSPLPAEVSLLLQVLLSVFQAATLQMRQLGLELYFV